MRLMHAGITAPGLGVLSGVTVTQALLQMHLQGQQQQPNSTSKQKPGLQVRYKTALCNKALSSIQLFTRSTAQSSRQQSNRHTRIDPQPFKVTQALQQQ
jgi:hypothetical protein